MEGIYDLKKLVDGHASIPMYRFFTGRVLLGRRRTEKKLARRHRSLRVALRGKERRWWRLHRVWKMSWLTWSKGM